MSGILIFDSVSEAVKAGFEIVFIYDDGFVHARRRTPQGWACALVRPLDKRELRRLFR